ncbi:hypothetical protein BJV74DRAFT_799475 [Russula compacta]|nr:hypothetical protein BJV74DRAFT_799475 [Russula compacta]
MPPSPQDINIDLEQLESMSHWPKQRRAKENRDQAPDYQPTQLPRKSIKDRVAKAEIHGKKKARAKANLRDPIENYTKGPMPKVHLMDLMAVLCNIDYKVIAVWEICPNEKLLIQPFSSQVLNIENYEMIKLLTFSVIIEITNTNSVVVAEPTPKSPSKKAPISLLVDNLLLPQKLTLLQREVWSSPQITFCALPFDLACLDFLFTIKGLTTLQTPEGHAAV